MKTAALFFLSLISCILPIEANMVKNYNATFHKGGYFNYVLESWENMPVILRTVSDMNQYKNDLIDRIKNDEAFYPADYLYRIENEIMAFYSCFDEAFFEHNNLVIALVDRGSGSLSFEIRELAMQGDTLVVSINRNSPMIQTMDYRMWVMMLEINKDCFNGDNIDIKIY